MSVHQIYLEELAKRGHVSDPAQLRAVAALDRCASDWAAYEKTSSNPFKNGSVDPKFPGASICTVV